MPVGLSNTEDAEGVVGALGSEAITQRLEEWTHQSWESGDSTLCGSEGRSQSWEPDHSNSIPEQQKTKACKELSRSNRHVKTKKPTSVANQGASHTVMHTGNKITPIRRKPWETRFKGLEKGDEEHWARMCLSCLYWSLPSPTKLLLQLLKLVFLKIKKHAYLCNV